MAKRKEVFFMAEKFTSCTEMTDNNSRLDRVVNDLLNGTEEKPSKIHMLHQNRL
jgi:hypothetical protein